MDKDNPTAEGIAIKDGKIIDVGSRQEISKYAKGNTKVDILNKRIYLSRICGHSYSLRSYD